MRFRFALPAVVTLLALSMPARGQDYDLMVIEDSVRWAVDGSERARTQRWWLVQSSDVDGAAVAVLVRHGEPYCTKTVEPCIDGEWSRQVDVRSLQNSDIVLTPPYYLVNGRIDPASTRTARMNGGFDSSSRESTISISLGDELYRLSRRRTDDDSRIIVTVSAGSVTQELYACETGGESYPFCGDEGFEEILWSGDLDGDNRLDLIAQFTPKYSVRNYYLFTSAGTDAEEHMRLAAQYTQTTD